MILVLFMLTAYTTSKVDSNLCPTCLKWMDAFYSDDFITRASDSFSYICKHIFDCDKMCQLWLNIKIIKFCYLNQHQEFITNYLFCAVSINMLSKVENRIRLLFSMNSWLFDDGSFQLAAIQLQSSRLSGKQEESVFCQLSLFISEMSKPVYFRAIYLAAAASTKQPHT